MKIISYNVMFNDIGKNSRRDRFQKIMKNILAIKPKPDIILLQEVFHKDLDIFLSLKERGYETSDIFVKTVLRDKYNNFVFVKKRFADKGTFTYKYFNQSLMYRGMAIFQLGQSGGSAGSGGLKIISTHLESLNEKRFAENRESQIKQLYKEIAKTNYIVGMDSNTTENLVNDIWVNDPIPTWHQSRYFDGNLELRFDRFLVKGVEVVDKVIFQWDTSDHDCLSITVDNG